MLLQTLCRGWGLEAHVLLLNDTVYLDVSHLRAVRRSLVTLDGQRPLCLGGRGLKAVLLWSEPRGAYSTFWAAARCQCELHHPDTVRLAQPVAEMHHGRRPADAAVKTLDFQGNELLFLFNYSSLCFSQNAIVNICCRSDGSTFSWFQSIGLFLVQLLVLPMPSPLTQAARSTSDSKMVAFCDVT